MFYTVIVVYIFHPSCDSSSSRYRFCHSKPEGDVLLRALPEKIPFFAGLRFLVTALARNRRSPPAGAKGNDNVRGLIGFLHAHTEP